MASTYTANLGVEKIGSGEQAGTWGNTTNNNFDIIDRAINGVGAISLSGTTHTLTTTDGNLTDGGFRVLVFTGALGANNTVTISPNDQDKVYLVQNSTTDSGSSGPYSVILSQGSGGNATILNGEIAWVFADGAGSGAAVTKQSVELVNDSSPSLGGDLDVNGNDIVSTSNANIDIVPNGTGDVTLQADTVQVGDNNANATITTNGTGDLILNTNSGTDSGTITIADGANGNINIAPNGTGVVQAGGSAVKVAGKETIYVPASAMYPNTTNGCSSLTQVELSNGPEIKVLDFDPSSDENAQFTVAFPKSWNEGTLTFQVFFTVTGTNTGTVAWGLSGVAIADNDSCNTAFGTNVVATAKAHSGTSNDINVTAESGSVTVAGSPSTDEFVFFQIMRDVSADDQTGDARLLGIKLFFTTDAANDS
tara:strand:+ start:521 stop:1789 length:1269 start_codon:yes stop_codon:yes gene_type:complete